MVQLIPSRLYHSIGGMELSSIDVFCVSLLVGYILGYTEARVSKHWEVHFPILFTVTLLFFILLMVPSVDWLILMWLFFGLIALVFFGELYYLINLSDKYQWWMPLFFSFSAVLIMAGGTMYYLGSTVTEQADLYHGLWHLFISMGVSCLCVYMNLSTYSV
jgi:predicted membrane channel-forming protein YqfA (hemolysin III family)